MKLLAHVAILCMVGASPVAAVQINEVRIDQPGSDEDEYFELWGTPGQSLDGYSYVVIGDGAHGSGQIEMALDLTGSSLSASGFFLAAEDADTFGSAADLIASLTFENSDNVTHLLVTGFSGSVADDLDTDDDGSLEMTPWLSVVDGLALVEDLDLPPSSTEFHYAGLLGLPVVGPDGSAVPGHAYRFPDGGPFQVGAFDPVGGRDTPGAANVPEPASFTLLMVTLVGVLRQARRCRSSGL